MAEIASRQASHRRHHPVPQGGPIHVMALIDNLGFWGGGAERIAREISVRIDRARFRSTLCVYRLPVRDIHWAAHRRTVDALEQQGVRVLELDRNGRWDLGAWRPVIAYLRRERVSILHGHKFGGNFWASAIGGLAGVPAVIAHEHGWSYSGQPWRKLLDRELVARRCDAMIASSRAALRQMVEIERLDPQKLRLVYIPNGISEPRLSGGSVREELGIGPDAPMVVAVARLDAYKSLDVLIESSAKLSSEFPDLRVVIAGDGPERVRLEQLIAARSVSHAITLLGYRADAPDIVDASDVAVLCSNSETTPLAVMEYMALAKPIVATRVGGIPDQITDGREGILVPPYDPDALAGAIAALLRRPDQAATMGARARVRQRREFSIEAMLGRVEQLYGELLSSSGASPVRSALERSNLGS